MDNNIKLKLTQKETYLLLKAFNFNNKKIQITPLVKSLSGMIQLPVEVNIRDSYGDFLTNKYL